MELNRAAAQISEIHAQMLKSEVFRGYRTWPMVATGVMAMVAALLETSVMLSLTPVTHAIYWIVVATVCARGGTAGCPPPTMASWVAARGLP